VGTQGSIPVTVFAVPAKGRPSDDAAVERAFLERIAPEDTIFDVVNDEVLARIEHPSTRIRS